MSIVDFVHVIADECCRGGILEPNAVVGIKIREAQLGKIMERSGVDKSQTFGSLAFITFLLCVWLTLLLR